MGALALYDEDMLLPRDVFVTPELFERRKELLVPERLIFPQHQVTLHKPEDFAAMMPARERDFEAWLEALALGDERAVAWMHTFVRRRRGASFSAYSDTYNSGTGTATTPAGASNCTLTSDGGGCGGGRATSVGAFDASGGGGGARCVTARAVSPGDQLGYTVGAAGAGETTAGTPIGSPGGHSTTSGGTGGFASLAHAANGAASRIGATASGGGTNTNGVSGALGDSATANGAGGDGGGGGAGGGAGGRGGGGGGGHSSGVTGGVNGGAGCAGRHLFSWS